MKAVFSNKFMNNVENEYYFEKSANRELLFFFCSLVSINDFMLSSYK